MPWYAWVFDGVGAAIVVPLIGWVVTRFQRKALVFSADATSQSNPQQATANSPGPPLTSGPGQPPDEPRRPPAEERPSPTDLVDLLLAVPGMTDPMFRQRLYEHLPQDVAQQLRLDGRAARPELIGVIDTFAEYPHLSPWLSLLSRLEQLFPAHRGVRLLAAELARQGLV